METLILNIGGNKKRIRYEMLDGRKHMVVPANLLKEGVINGSQGPLLYRDAEIAKWATAWNHKPIVLYHPEINGRGVSACDPIVLNSAKLGVLLRSAHKKLLQSEAWLDDEYLDQRAAAVKNELLAGKQVEISTGLDLDVVQNEGEWEGISYVGEAVNHRPDHLAILPGKVGAFSVRDGGGMGVLNEMSYNQRWIQTEREKLPKGDFGDPGNMAFPVINQEDLDNAVYLIGNADNPELVRRRLISIAKRKGLKIPEAWQKLMTKNAMSHSQMDNSVSVALRARQEITGQSWCGWVMDVYDSYVIYCEEGQCYKQDYRASPDGSIQLIGDPIAVERITMYQTTDGKPIGNSNPVINKEKVMDKQKFINDLITNKLWGEEDREWLNSQSEQRLEKLGKAPASGTPPVVTNAQSPAAPPAPLMPVEQYIKTQVPAEYRELLGEGLLAFNEERNRLVTEITANAQKCGIPFDAQALAQRPMGDLRFFAALCRGNQPAESPQIAPVGYRPLFIGNAGGPPPAVQAPGSGAANNQETLQPVRYDFSRK